MTARPRTLATISLCALLVLAGVGAAVVAAQEASAHESDCHVQQTCPSDDGGYAWTDPNGQGWVCVLAGARAEATLIVYDGQRYDCEPVTPPPPPSTTPVETQPSTTRTAPAAPTTTRSAKPRQPKPSGAVRPKATKRDARAKRPDKPSEPTEPAPVDGGFGSPSSATPALAGGPYLFPVLGPSAFIDTFGAPRATVSWHHGDDIFAPAGSPVIAVASGTLFAVGWNDIGGKRLWLRDREGNEFYYAHLSAFSALAAEGAQVAAGDVLGYVGTTGDARGTPAHLHFEIHPVSMLGLGYDGAVNPTGYLDSWRRSSGGRRGAGAAPRPGAILIAYSDIATASGLDRGSLLRAFAGRAAGDGDDPVADLRLGGRNLHWTAAERSAAEAELRATATEFARASSRLFGSAVWDALAVCEAGGDWSADTGNGYAGGLQFAPETWLGFGGGSYARTAAAATRAEQITVAEIVLAAQGWDAWPTCSRLLGLRAE